MRHSGLVVATILLVSATLLAQHSSGSGGSSGGASSGGSHGGYSGGSSSSASTGGHVSSSSASHVGSTGMASSRSPVSSNVSSKVSPTKENVTPEKKGFFSALRHPFRKPVQKAEFNRTCLKGPCPVCPPGESRNGRGACAASNVCTIGLSLNGFACGTPAWSDDCRVLAAQLAEGQQQRPGQDNPDQHRRHHFLLNQYQQCLDRSRLALFGGFTFSDALLLDTF